MTTETKVEAVARYHMAIRSGCLFIELEDDGQWVDYDDHQSALDALRGEVERLGEQLRYAGEASCHETTRADAAERRVAAITKLAVELRREARLCDNDANRQRFDSFASMLEHALTKKSP